VRNNAIDRAHKLGRRFSQMRLRKAFGWRPRVARELYARCKAGDDWSNVALLEAIRRQCATFGIPFQIDLEDLI